MEIINKSHCEILPHKKRPAIVPFFKIEKNARSLYFSAEAVSKFGIIAGVMINFINDGDDWLFYCDSNDDGFPVIQREGLSSSYAVISCASLARLFLKRTQTSIGVKFQITETGNKIDGCHILKIEINKIIE